jgi:hypothetical protein
MVPYLWSQKKSCFYSPTDLLISRIHPSSSEPPTKAANVSFTTIRWLNIASALRELHGQEPEGNTRIHPEVELSSRPQL